MVKREPRLKDHQVRVEVARVMGCWQNFQGFGGLLDALMRANRGMSDGEFARSYASRTGRSLSKSRVHSYRVGESTPPYQFVEDLLKFDLLSLGGADETRGGDLTARYADALFAAAGLVRVTADAVAQWNIKLFNELRLERMDGRPPPTWGDFMRRLLEIQTQGNRLSLDRIGETIHPGAPKAWMSRLLRNFTVPDSDNRQKLYQLAALSATQSEELEGMLAQGNIVLGFVQKRTKFADAFESLLEQLQANGVSLPALAKASQLDKSVLLGWRRGKNLPSLISLRDLSRGIEQLYRDGITTSELHPQIKQAVEAAGFVMDDLTATASEIVGRDWEAAGIKPLLKTLRFASDIAATRREVGELKATKTIGSPSAPVLERWEEPGKTYPTPGQVQALLDIYNALIRSHGGTALNNDEMSRVMELAQRDYDHWRQLPRAAKFSQMRKDEEQDSPRGPGKAR